MFHLNLIELAVSREFNVLTYNLIVQLKVA